MDSFTYKIKYRLYKNKKLNNNNINELQNDYNNIEISSSSNEEEDYYTQSNDYYDLNNQYDVTVEVKGGGITAQLDSIRLALAKAICTINADYRPVLKKNLFLRRDSRIKERRKYGLKKARKASQYSKR